MFSNILKDIICSEFEQNVGLRQSREHLASKPMYRMQINFRLHELDYEKSPRYPHASLMLFAGGNYVGVYYQVSEDRDETGPWQHLSLHDSCWRDDGVGWFIQMYRDRISTLRQGLGNSWYSKLEVSPEFAAELREITKEKCGS